MRTCPLCFSPLASAEALEAHLRLELRYAPLRCSLCPAEFLDEPAARAHFRGRFPAHPDEELRYVEVRDEAKETRLEELLRAAGRGPKACRRCHCCRDWQSGGLPPLSAQPEQLAYAAAPLPHSQGRALPEEDASEEEEAVASPLSPERQPESRFQTASEDTLPVEVKMELAEKVDAKAGFPADGKVACMLCEVRMTKSVFKYHVQTKHMEARPYLCNICPHRCQTKSSMTQHFTLDLSNKLKRKLEQCFGSVNEIPATKVRCRECRCDIRSEFKVQHIATKHRKKVIHSCKLCPYTSTMLSVSGLNKHMKEVHRLTKGTPDNCVSEADKYEPLVKRMLPDLFSQDN